jgi:hypothetical protein
MALQDNKKHGPIICFESGVILGAHPTINLFDADEPPQLT